MKIRILPSLGTILSVTCAIITITLVCVQPRLAAAREGETILANEKSGMGEQEPGNTVRAPAARLWRSFKSAEGESWQVRWDKRTGYARMLYGSHTKEYGPVATTPSSETR